MLESAPTPTALVDLAAFTTNCHRMTSRAAELGVRLRPHVKTHKTIEGALIQCGGKPGPITVSTLAEATFFAAAGFADITYAVPIAPHKLPRALEIAGRIDRLNLILDDAAAAAAVEHAAGTAGMRVSVLLEIDCGGHRTGADPTSATTVELARRLAESPHIEFRGLLTHAGQAYSCRNPREVASVARHERDVLAQLAQQLCDAGIPVGEVSVGSTPTAIAVDGLDGVTEIRPGNYAFFDAFQAAVGTCSLDDCAFTVLTTVIGCHPERRQIVVDAGALALSKDPGARHLDSEFGYGAVYTADRSRRLWELRVTDLSQEHGVVAVNSPRRAEEFPIGSRLQVVPNHSCLAAALFDRYLVVEAGELRAVWQPARGW